MPDPTPKRTSAAERHDSRWFRSLLLAAALLSPGLTGCASYHVGAASLYPPDIHTVYVPMFDSLSFRRNLGERLTEAVIKQIELKTPYKVVNTPNADSVLTGRLLTDSKRVLVETPTDEPRVLDVGLVVEVSWHDRRSDRLLAEQQVPIEAGSVLITQNAKLIPEVGRSGVTAQQQAIDRIAEQIVSLMEAPW